MAKSSYHPAQSVTLKHECNLALLCLPSHPTTPLLRYAIRQ